MGDKVTTRSRSVYFWFHETIRHVPAGARPNNSSFVLITLLISHTVLPWLAKDSISTCKSHGKWKSFVSMHGFSYKRQVLITSLPSLSEHNMFIIYHASCIPFIYIYILLLFDLIIRKIQTDLLSGTLV